MIINILFSVYYVGTSSYLARYKAGIIHLDLFKKILIELIA
jgi:hypothetical protein